MGFLKFRYYLKFIEKRYMFTKSSQSSQIVYNLRIFHGYKKCLQRQYLSRFKPLYKMRFFYINKKFWFFATAKYLNIKL